MNRYILFFLFISIQSFAQTADDVINKYIEASGGKEKWAKVYAVESSGNYVMGPGALAPVHNNLISKPFIGYYSDFSWQGMTGKTVMHGDSGWSYNPFSGKRDCDPLSPDAIRSIKLTADPQGILFNYKEKGFTADYLGSDDMDGSDVYKIRLTNKDGDMVYFYIDQQTYYVLEVETRMKLKDREEKSYYTQSDFKKTDFGLTVPFSTQNVDENGNESGGPVNYSKIVFNGNVDLTLFEKPTAGRP